MSHMTVAFLGLKVKVIHQGQTLKVKVKGENAHDTHFHFPV